MPYRRPVPSLPALLGALLAAAGCASPRASAPDSPLDRAGWLVGTWRGSADGAPFYEEWTHEGDSALVNRTYGWCGADTAGTDVTPLRLRPGGALTFGERGPVWTATAVEPGRLVLESPAAPYSQRIVHTRSPEGHWIADLYTNGALTRYRLRPDEPVAARKGRAAPAPPSGTYRGTLALGGRTVPLALRLAGGDVFGIRPDGGEAAAVDVCTDGPHLRFRLPDGPNVLDVQATVAGDSLTGRVRAGAARGSFRLVRAG